MPVWVCETLEAWSIRLLRKDFDRVIHPVLRDEIEVSPFFVYSGDQFCKHILVNYGSVTRKICQMSMKVAQKGFH